METRIQTINNDTVLEIIETKVEKTRHSEANLLAKKEYYEAMIARCQEKLIEVNALLNTISNEKSKR